MQPRSEHAPRTDLAIRPDDPELDRFGLTYPEVHRSCLPAGVTPAHGHFAGLGQGLLASVLAVLMVEGARRGALAYAGAESIALRRTAPDVSLSDLEPGAAVPDALVPLIEAAGGELWIARPGDKRPELLAPVAALGEGL